MVREARVRRISDRIHQELSLVLQREVADPRLAMVTVTAVEVDRELAFATIYVTALGTQDRMKEVLSALESARGYLRRELAARVRLRSFPQLRFQWDLSYERGTRIDELLDMLNSDRTGGEGETGEG
jgi:ribosome-binding factor A